MKKGDFIGGIPVQPLGGGQVMILGGTPDNWICTWTQDGVARSEHFLPEQLEPAPQGS